MLIGMDSERDQAIMRSTIRGYVERWRAGVELQHERLRQSSSEINDELDAFYFAVALKNLRENVRWASDYCNGEHDGARGRPLGAALIAFDRAVPGAANVRDLQEHARHYETGASDRHLKHVKPPLAIFWENDGTTCVVYVGGYRLDCGAASIAAASLADAALAALS
jgi:hypothetical protein